MQSQAGGISRCGCSLFSHVPSRCTWPPAWRRGDGSFVSFTFVPGKGACYAYLCAAILVVDAAGAASS
eukprot:7406292-Pyramimonas_sp.AAC.1